MKKTLGLLMAAGLFGFTPVAMAEDAAVEGDVVVMEIAVDEQPAVMEESAPPIVEEVADDVVAEETVAVEPIMVAPAPGEPGENDVGLEGPAEGEVADEGVAAEAAE